MASSKYQPPKLVQPEHQEFFEKVGARLKSIREEKGITIIQLSSDLKISRNSIPKIEDGKLYFNTLTLLRILNYFCVDPSEFFQNL